MKCHEIRVKIPAYLERTLSPTDRSLVQLHLKECHECQKVLLSYSSVQNRELPQQEAKKNLKKTGFKPKRIGVRNQDVQTRLQAAGLIVPTSLAKAKIDDSENVSQNEQTISVENSGEVLLRKHMLAMLAAEEETIKVNEPEEKQSDTNDDESITQEQSEAEFQWTREMSLEAAMSGGIIEDQEMNELIKEQPIHAPPITTVINWQEDPSQFVEIPYIHPVTRSEVLKKVRRNSMEGILYLESEAEKTRATEIKQEEATLPFDSIVIEEIASPVVEMKRSENLERTPAEIAKERLLRQIAETEQSGEINTKPRTINQIAKTLPFRESTKKQAVLYRFFTIILVLVLSAVLFLLWQNSEIALWNGML